MLNRILAVIRREYLERVKHQGVLDLHPAGAGAFWAAVMIIPALARGPRRRRGFTVADARFHRSFRRAHHRRLDDMLGRQASAAEDALKESGVMHGEQAEAVAEMAEESILDLTLVPIETPAAIPRQVRERGQGAGSRSAASSTGCW